MAERKSFYSQYLPYKIIHIFTFVLKVETDTISHQIIQIWDFLCRYFEGAYNIFSAERAHLLTDKTNH